MSTLEFIVSGTTDPSVVAYNAPRGTIYLRIGALGGALYEKQDNGLTTNWTLITTGGITALTGDVTATGPGSVPATLANVGVAGTYVKVTTDAKGRVTAGVVSPLSIADGGTGQVTANAAFAALSPMTTNGDLITEAGGVPVRLGAGLANQILTIVAGLPTWQTLNAITALTGDVTATGPGSVPATLANVGIAGTYVKVTTDAKGRVTSGSASPQAIADGGTGQTTANAAFAALSPMTTDGDLITRAAGVPVRLAVGTAGQVLTTVAGAPAWQTPSASFYNVLSISANTAGVSTKTYLCDTSGAAFTVTLPVPVLNAYVIIKDSTGSFQTNNLSVAPNGAEKIEGLAATKLLQTNWGAFVFLSNGTDWFMM